MAGARSFIAPVSGGYVVLQPVALSEGRLAVIEVYVPAGDAAHGVTASWAVMTAVAIALIAVSVLVADRLATRVTRPARELAATAAAVGGGNLSARSSLGGPAELVAVGQAFNVMAERLDKLIAAERVLAADLPHRLRTPLTALRMNVAALGPGRAADDTRVAVDRLEQEVDLIIRRRAAARPRRAARLRRRRGAQGPDGFLVGAGRGPGPRLAPDRRGRRRCRCRCLALTSWRWWTRCWATCSGTPPRERSSR